MTATFVGGPNCGLPVPRSFSGAFVARDEGTYEWRGGRSGNYVFRGRTVNKCPGCGSFVSLSLEHNCPLCGATLAQAPPD